MPIGLGAITKLFFKNNIQLRHRKPVNSQRLNLSFFSECVKNCEIFP